MRLTCKLLTVATILTATLFSAHSAKALPLVQVTQVEENNDSVRVYFRPVAGAVDYRGYSLDNPKEVKYAGILHLFAPNGQHWVVGGDGRPQFPYRTEANGQRSTPERIDVPATDIELNGIDPSAPVKIVIEAVDHVGPSPFSNLATEQNAPVSPKSHSQGKLTAMPMSSTNDNSDVMELLGSNAGPTDDGKYSINGQSGPHVIPKVIARSAPITVKPTGLRALPSTSEAKQVVFDTFSQGHIDEIPGTRNVREGNVSFLMHTDATWRIDFENDDISHSRPFIMNRHYMDVLFDGGTPGSNEPLHIAHGASTMSPVQPANFSGGRMLHVTMEADAHVDGRRWLAFDIVPWNDPIRNFYFINAEINKSDTGIFVDFYNDHIATSLFSGKSHTALAGALGQAETTAYRHLHEGYNGRGLDNRSRFDLFLSKSHYVVFEDGELIIDQKFPGGLPLTMQHVKVYYTHYLYHTGNEINDVKTYRPWEHFWSDLFPYSDERHWDNMGFEVLPVFYASASDETLGKLVRNSRSLRVMQAVDLLARR